MDTHHRTISTIIPRPYLTLISGIILFILFIYFMDLSPGNPEITYTAGIALLMAFWWISEAIPLAVTSLIPIVLFPAFGVLSGKHVASLYFNHIIFIFIGGFIVALAMQKWNLHKRIALKTLFLFGSQPKSILLGFMSATAFLSMWISNTATTMMMVPIVLAIIINLEESLGSENVKKYEISMLLGVAYSASIGGIATLIGTPPNLAFAGIFNDLYPLAPKITFSQWFIFALPITIFLLLLIWGILSAVSLPKSKHFCIDVNIYKEEYKKLGPMRYEEIVVLILFILLAVMWLTRSNITIGDFTFYGWSNLFPNSKYINDGTVGIFISILLFMFPSRDKNVRIMDWETARKIPWHIVLLFGGGFALASAFKESGLSVWLGGQLKIVESVHPFIMILVISGLLTFLTEVTSNTATSMTFLPIIAALATAIGINPLFLMIPATLSCSFAFMLPVATPPNAIVFGTDRLKISDMAKMGLVLNFIGILTASTAVYFLGRWVFDIDLTQAPHWIK